MEFDKERNGFHLDPRDLAILALPKAYSEIPLEAAPELLERAEQTRELLLQRDPSEFPAGGLRAEMIATHQHNLQLLRKIITAVEGHMPSVADGAEAFLRSL